MRVKLVNFGDSASATPGLQRATLDHQETLFLPITVTGETALVRTDGGKWLVVMPAAAAAEGSEGLGYRRSKCLDDKHSKIAIWGSLVEGTDTGDGWLQTQVMTFAFPTSVEMFRIDSPSPPSEMPGGAHSDSLVTEVQALKATIDAGERAIQALVPRLLEAVASGDCDTTLFAGAAHDLAQITCASKADASKCHPTGSSALVAARSADVRRCQPSRCIGGAACWTWLRRKRGRPSG